MICDQNSRKFHQNPKKPFYYEYTKFCGASINWKVKNFINKKLVVSIFVTNRFEKYFLVCKKKAGRL